MKELQITNIKKMIASGESREIIANRIESTLEEIFKEVAKELPTSDKYAEAVNAAKQLLEIYTNEENHLDWNQSDMHGKIIMHNAMLNPGQTLLHGFYDPHKPDKSVVINGVSMTVKEAIMFFDDFIGIHQSLTKRFFFDKLHEPDEVISELIADAMRQFIKKGK